MNSYGETKLNVLSLVIAIVIKKGNDKMPAFKTSKYSTVQNQQIALAALDVLAHSPVPLTIDEICASDLTLTYQTNQKMARELNKLVEVGFVKKTKSKAKGKMIYAAVAQLEEQGYDIENLIC